MSDLIERFEELKRKEAELTQENLRATVQIEQAEARLKETEKQLKDLGIEGDPQLYLETLTKKIEASIDAAMKSIETLEGGLQ